MVTMETVETAAKCIRTLHQSRFKGARITVKKVSPEQRDPRLCQVSDFSDFANAVRHSGGVSQILAYYFATWMLLSY